MTLATLTSKGQLTVPKEVRDRLGLKPGDRVDIRIEPDGTARLLPATLKTQDVFGLLAAYRKKRPVSLEQMERDIQQAIRKQRA